MVRSDPALDYLLLHGVRTLDDCYETEAYAADRYVPCVSRGSGGYQGRVTDYLREHPVAASTPCFSVRQQRHDLRRLRPPQAAGRPQRAPVRGGVFLSWGY